MILRIILSICIFKLVLAVQWNYYGIPGSPSGPSANLNYVPDGMQKNMMHGKDNLMEILGHNTKCYSLKSMMKMMRGVLTYLAENPSKVNYLQYLIKFLEDGNENAVIERSHKIGDVLSTIERDQQLGKHDIIVLRQLLDLDPLIPDMKTKIVFKYELPSLNQPQCKDVFIKLMEVAHNTYMRMAKYPTCDTNQKEKYDKSNKDQPGLPLGEMDWHNPNISGELNKIIGSLKPGDDQPNVPNYPSHFPKIDDLNIGNQYSGGNPATPQQQPDLDENLKNLITNIFMNLRKPSNEARPPENPIDIPENPNLLDQWNPNNPNNFLPSIPDNEPPFGNIPGPPSVKDDKYFNLIYSIKPENKKYLNDKSIKTLIALLTQYNNEHDTPNPKFLEYILSFLKPSQGGVIDGRLNSLLQVILPLVGQNKNTDPKVIQILMPLLRPNVNGVVNPNTLELILTLLKLNVKDVSNQKYTLLLNLLHPDENGEVNPKMIEIINSLLKLNENSTPNYKIIQVLLSFLKPEENSMNPKNIDILLYLLKLNNNHKLPEALYYQIIQFLLKLNLNKKEVPGTNNFHSFYQYPHNIDGRLLTILLAKNPLLFYKLAPGAYGSASNQLNPYQSGVIELTYLLKHPKPFVYQPFYYVKYRLPMLKFLSNVRNLISKNPQYSANPAKLYQDLINISNVTEISPNLKGYSKEDILKMTVNSGALVTAKILDHNNINFNEQIKLVQDINSDVQPDDILKQTDRIFNEKEFNDETSKLDKYWSTMHPENNYDLALNVGGPTITGTNQTPNESNFQRSKVSKKKIKAK